MRDMCGIEIGVTPFQGWLFFRFQYPGLKPWANVLRPFRAWGGVHWLPRVCTLGCRVTPRWGLECDLRPFRGNSPFCLLRPFHPLNFRKH